MTPPSEAPSGEAGTRVRRFRCISAFRGGLQHLPCAVGLRAPGPTMRFDHLAAASASSETSLPLLAWILMLMLPAATTQSAWHAWDVAPVYLWLASCWSIVVLRLVVPSGRFFVLTYPIALAGLICLAADVLRNVNLLELALHWRTFTAEEVRVVLRPYVAWIALGAAGLALVAWSGMRLDARRPPWPAMRRWVVAAVGTASLAAMAPASVWARAWPLNGVLLAASAIGDAPWLTLRAAPQDASTSPRDPAASWQAVRAVAPQSAEVYCAFRRT